MKCFVILCLSLAIYFVNGKDVRLIFEDQIFDCDGSAETNSKYIDISEFEMNQIDDENVELYGKFIIKFTFPNEKWEMDLRTEHLNHGIWTKAPIQITTLDGCKEFQNSNQFWYNFTKNMGVDGGCPPKEGDIWIIDRQILQITAKNVPSATPEGKWRSFLNVYQGVMKKNKFCLKFHLDVIPIA